MTASLKDRLAEAVDFALLHGLIKYTPRDALAHAPFTLTPCPLPAAAIDEMARLTPTYNAMALAMARDPAFLADTLGPAAGQDDFLARLLAMGRPRDAVQPLSLLLTRIDYLMQGAAGSGGAAPKLVELNTISAAYAGLAGRVNALHRHLLQGTDDAARLVINDPLGGMVDALAAAIAAYGHADACCLMVIQPGERNIFDQRLLEFGLRERGIPTVRLALADVPGATRLQGGHLLVGGRPAAVTYLRAGYGPEDYDAAAAWQGRERIEASSTIAVPDVLQQLTGAKKVQQRLTAPEVLQRYCPAEHLAAVAATFVGQHGLDDPITGQHAAAPAWQVARDNPAQFVLKPQREGGGNNLYDADLAARLESLSPSQRHAYILMERIYSPPHPALCAMEGRLREGAHVSEVGRFGTLLADGGNIQRNTDVGYLVRTKGESEVETGISAGFGHLDSLLRS